MVCPRKRVDVSRSLQHLVVGLLASLVGGSLAWSTLNLAQVPIACPAFLETSCLPNCEVGFASWKRAMEKLHLLPGPCCLITPSFSDPSA